MKGLLSLLLTSCSLFALAQNSGQLGTKPDIVSKSVETSSQPVVGGMEFLQMGIALVIVFSLLKFGLPKLMGKFGKSLSTNLNGSISLKEGASFGAGTLQVIEVRGKTLLLAVTQNSVSCLADLTGEKAAKEQAFFEMMDEKIDSETQPLAIPNPEPTAQVTEPKIHAGAKIYLSGQKSEPSDQIEDGGSLESRLTRLKKLVS